MTSALKYGLRESAGAARHLLDRLLHARRRAEAKRMLQRLSIQRVVFICHGNINRSAYAAVAFTQALPAYARKQVQVSSMGFIGPDRPASDLAQLVAARRGMDLGQHRSRVIDVSELKQMDLIAVMTVRQRDDVQNLVRPARDRILILGDLDPARLDTRTIQDPYGHSEDVFERVFDRIDRCIRELVTSVWSS